MRGRRGYTLGRRRGGRGGRGGASSLSLEQGGGSSPSSGLRSSVSRETRAAHWVTPASRFLAHLQDSGVLCTHIFTRLALNEGADAPVITHGASLPTRAPPTAASERPGRALTRSLLRPPPGFHAAVQDRRRVRDTRVSPGLLTTT